MKPIRLPTQAEKFMSPIWEGEKFSGGSGKVIPITTIVKMTQEIEVPLKRANCVNVRLNREMKPLQNAHP